MKLHAFQTLAILFIAVFVPTKGEENEVSENQDEATTNTRGRRLGEVTAVSVVPNTGSAAHWSAAYATSQSVKITFTTNQDITNAHFVYIQFPEGFTFNVGGTTDCTSSGIAGTFVETIYNQILSLQRDGSSGTFSAGTDTITCTLIKYPTPYRPSSPQKTGKFVVWTTADQTKGSVDYVGIPLIYFVRSECKVGGLAGAEQVACGEAGDCQTCTGLNGFVPYSGLQKTDSSCENGKSPKTQHRCDVIYRTDSSLDVAVNTNGNFGTLTCGAYTSTNTPSYNIRQDPSSNKKSDNSVMVDISRRYDDQVVTLFNLPSDTLFDVYCHMDDYIMSPALKNVRTDKNDRIWDDSLVPATTVTGVSPGTITLTFKHGLALSNGNVITLTASWDTGGTPAAIFDGNTACTATSEGSSLTLTGQGAITGTATAFTLGAGSTAGSEIVIVCNSALEDNKPVAAAGKVQYDLAVQNHPVTLKNRYGWASTA